MYRIRNPEMSKICLNIETTLRHFNCTVCFEKCMIKNNCETQKTRKYVAQLSTVTYNHKLMLVIVTHSYRNRPQIKTI
jgi:hypothetical protein